MGALVAILSLSPGCDRPPAHTGPWRVVVLEPDDPPPPEDVRAGLMAGLEEGGATKDADVVVRASRAPVAALGERMRQEIAAGADIVLAVTTSALAAALPSELRAAVPDAPPLAAPTGPEPAVVFTDVADPGSAGVRNPPLLARWLPALFAPTGPPVTGAYAVSDFGALLHLAEPLTTGRALGTVFAANDADSAAYSDQLRAFAAATVMQEPLAAGEAAKAVQALCNRQVRTLVLLGDRTTDAALSDIMAAAGACRMVVLGTRAAHAEAGAVLTLARDERAGAAAAGRRAAAMLRGERPEHERFERLSEARLVLNAGAAEQVGIGLPLELVTQADDVIGDER